MSCSATTSRLLKNDAAPSERDRRARDKDAGSTNSSAIGATEDAVSRRPACPDGRDFVLQQPPKSGEAGSPEPGGSKPGLISVGVLSDTHGHLYPEVKALLEGVTHIIHAGDVGSQQVLAELRAVAPVTAVRGNCDYEAWAQSLPARAELELGGIRILVGHVPAQARAWADDARRRERRPVFSVVISGHSHVTAVERREGVLYLNPGSAGPRRFNRPRTVARLLIVPAPGSRPVADGRAPEGPRLQAEILVAED